MKKLGIILMLALAMSLITIHCVSLADVITIQHHISSLYFDFDAEPQRATLPPRTGKATATNCTLKVNSIKWQSLGDGTIRPVTLGEDELLKGGKYKATVEVERTAGDGIAATTSVYVNSKKLDSSNINTTKLGENKLIFSIEYTISTAPTTGSRLSNANNAAFSNVDIINLDFYIDEPLIGAEPTWSDGVKWTTALENNIEISNVAWISKSKSGSMLKGQKFEADSYNLKMYFKVLGTNVKLADNAVVTINGDRRVNVYYQKDTAKYWFEYTWPTLTKEASTSTSSRPSTSRPGTGSRSDVTPTASVADLLKPSLATSISRPLERLSGDILVRKSGDTEPTSATFVRPSKSSSAVSRPTSATSVVTRPSRSSGDSATATPTVAPTATTAPTVTPTTAPTTAPTVAPTVVPTTAAEEVKKITWSSASKWALDELSKANDMGIIPTIFDKEDLTKNITRKEFAHVAVKLYEKVANKKAEPVSKNPFIDTKDTEVLKAYNVGITQGVSTTTFEPDTLINREQMATMMTRALQKAGVDTMVDLNKVSKFADDDLMSSWSRDSIYFMSNIEIIKGVGNNMFDVKGNASREAAILISVRSAIKFAK